MRPEPVPAPDRESAGKPGSQVRGALGWLFAPERIPEPAAGRPAEAAPPPEGLLRWLFGAERLPKAAFGEAKTREGSAGEGILVSLFRPEFLPESPAESERETPFLTWLAQCETLKGPPAGKGRSS